MSTANEMKRCQRNEKSEGNQYILEYYAIVAVHNVHEKDYKKDPQLPR